MSKSQKEFDEEWKKLFKKWEAIVKGKPIPLSSSFIRKINKINLTKLKKYNSNDFKNGGKGCILFTKEELQELVKTEIDAIEIFFPRSKKEKEIIIIYHRVAEISEEKKKGIT
jgi:hypothetical protein